MFLKKVHVKNFRGLQDVELEFNQALSPSVFPVGSLNGGGKSTLLQLIFILLRCASDPQKHRYVQNILKCSLNSYTQEEDVIIHFVINYCQKDIDIQFLTASQKIAAQKLDDFYQYEQTKRELGEEFGSGCSLDSVRLQLAEMNKIIQSLIKSKSSARSNISEIQERKIAQFFDDFRSFLKQSGLLKKFSDFRIVRYPMIMREERNNVSSIIETFNELSERLEEIESNLSELLDVLVKREQELGLVKEKLKQSGYNYITILSDDRLIFCKTSMEESILNSISEKVNFVCPLTQIFLFLEEKDRTYFFKNSESISSYIEAVDLAKKNIGNWQTYDFAPINLLVEIFKRCIAEDTKTLLKIGTYGDSVMQIQEDVNKFFSDKTLSVEEDFQTITFKKKDTNQNLLPEDLSHGELKKFGIYIWLKYMEISDAIVLMDEVEIGFHPDWQYSIVRDLLEWSNNNQFILATHSNDLCEAVTPAHVNEMEPRLNSKRQDSQEN